MSSIVGAVHCTPRSPSVHLALSVALHKPFSYIRKHRSKKIHFSVSYDFQAVATFRKTLIEEARELKKEISSKIKKD